ncbi:MAG: Spore photoproduct lyase, partial [uncultured Nocardioidaceae bacterium]
ALAPQHPGPLRQRGQRRPVGPHQAGGAGPRGEEGAERPPQRAVERLDRAVD